MPHTRFVPLIGVHDSREEDANRLYKKQSKECVEDHFRSIVHRPYAEDHDNCDHH